MTGFRRSGRRPSRLWPSCVGHDGAPAVVVLVGRSARAGEVRRSTGVERVGRRQRSRTFTEIPTVWRSVGDHVQRGARRRDVLKNVGDAVVAAVGE